MTSFINYFEDFNLWTKVHYYAFSNRKVYPNLFLFYFPVNGILLKGLNDDERSKIISYISNRKSDINGCWGYLSLLLEYKNGMEVYSWVNKSEFFEVNLALPCSQEKTCDFDEELKDKLKKNMTTNEERYEKVLQDFNLYLKEDHEKMKEFNEFTLKNENKVIFAYDSQKFIALLQELKKSGKISENDKIKKESENLKNNNKNKKRVLRKKIIFDSDEESNATVNEEVIDTEWKSPDKVKKTTGYPKVELTYNPNDVAYLEHEQKLDGYTSDHTKKVFNEKPLGYFSDNDSKLPKPRNKIHRVRVSGVTQINNISLNRKFDNDNVGITSNFENHYDKLKKGLLMTKAYKRTKAYKERKEKKPKQKEKEEIEYEVSESRFNPDEYYFYTNKSTTSNKCLSVGSNNSEKKKKKKLKPPKPVPVPTMSQAKEKNVFFQIEKLVTNTKFNALCHLFEFKKNRIEILSQKIKSTNLHLTSNSNDIDNQLLSSIKNQGKYTLSPEIIIDASNSTTDDYIKAFNFYKEKILQFFDIITGNSNFTNESEIVISLKQSEHLIKIMIKSLTKEKMNSDLENSFANIISEIFQNFILFYVHNILKDNNDISSKSFSLLLYTFIVIFQVIVMKMESQKYEILLGKFLKIFSIFLLIRIYLITDTDILKEVYDDMIVTSFSLFFLISEVYNQIDKFEMNPTYSMIALIFREFLTHKIEIDTQTLGDLNEICITDLSKFLSINDNCLFQDKFEENLKSKIKKYFLYKAFNLDNLVSTSLVMKKTISSNFLIILFERYFYIFFLFLIDYGSLETSYSSFFEKTLQKCHEERTIQDNYYDIQCLVTLIKTQTKSKTENNYIEKYLLSDSRVLLILDSHWLISSQTKLVIISHLFSIIFFQGHKNIVIDTKLITVEIFKLIPLIFNNGSQAVGSLKDQKDKVSTMPLLINFIYNISQCFTSSFKKSELDEISKFKFLSRYDTKMNIVYKFTKENTFDKSYTLSFIPLISTLLTLVQFAIEFSKKTNIEKVINRIKQILDSDRIRSILKSFNLAIWINLIERILYKKIDIDLSQYITMVNIGVLSVIKSHISLSGLNYGSHNLDESNETLLTFLNNLKEIAQNSPQVFFDNANMLEGIKEILNVDYSFSIRFRNDILEIIDTLIKQFGETVKREGATEEAIDLGDGDIIMASFDFDDNNVELNEKQRDFLMKIRNNFFPLFDKIVLKFFATHGANMVISNRNKIFFTTYRSVCSLQAKIYGVMAKYNCVFRPFDYCNRVLKDFPYFKTQNNLSKASFNKNEYELFTKMPFALFNIYLNTFDNLVQTQIENKRYKETLQYFVLLFFVGVFNKRSNETQIEEFDSVEIYLSGFVRCLKCVESMINSILASISSEINAVGLRERHREESSYYNILKQIKKCDCDSQLSPVNFISDILENITETPDITKIESKYLFGLLNNDLFSIAVDKVRTSIYDSEDKKKITSSYINSNMKIFEKYYNGYLKGTIDKSVSNYLDSLIKKISYDNLLLAYSIKNKVFILFIFNLLKEPSSSISEEKSKLLRSIVQYLLSKIDDTQISEKLQDITLCEEVKNKEIYSEDICINLIDYFPVVSSYSTKINLALLHSMSLSQILYSSRKKYFQKTLENCYRLVEKMKISENIVNEVGLYYIYFFFLEKILTLIQVSNHFKVGLDEKFIGGILSLFFSFINFSFNFMCSSKSALTKPDRIMISYLTKKMKMECYIGRIREKRNKKQFENVYEKKLFTKYREFLNKSVTMNKFYISFFKEFFASSPSQFHPLAIAEKINSQMEVF